MINEEKLRDGINLKNLITEIEVALLKRALECSPTKKGAAKLLGLCRTTFVMKLKKHGLFKKNEMPKVEEKVSPSISSPQVVASGN